MHNEGFFCVLVFLANAILMLGCLTLPTWAPFMESTEIFFKFLPDLFIFIRYSLCLHFKFYPLFSFPLWKFPLSHSHSPLFTNPPTPLPSPGIPLHCDLSQDQAPLLSLMSHKAIMCYKCGWSHGFLNVYSLVGGIVIGSSGVSGWLISLCGCKILNSFIPFSNSSTF